MADVVEITTFLTDVSGYGAFDRARAEVFTSGVPSRTAVAAIAVSCRVVRCRG
jgi:enamine deaminase RidA (YjgF/YER057c/UK114 family)